jgi:hypothetical protein
MHPGANASAFLVPLQGVTGCGAFHRRSPTGGAANGTPLNDATSPATTPCTFPPLTFAVLICAAAGPAKAKSAAIASNAKNNLLTLDRFWFTLHLP